MRVCFESPQSGRHCISLGRQPQDREPAPNIPRSFPVTLPQPRAEPGVAAA